MSERRQHWQAIAISIGLHLLPLLLLVHWVAAPPLLPPPEQDVRISLRLLAPATPPQPVEERQADTPSQAQQARASQPTKSPPPPKPTAAREGELAASEHGGPGRQALPVAPPETARELAQEADRVVCLERPLRFRALGYYYLSFPQLTDDEVTGTLHALESERMAPRGPG